MKYFKELKDKLQGITILLDVVIIALLIHLAIYFYPKSDMKLLQKEVHDYRLGKQITLEQFPHAYCQKTIRPDYYIRTSCTNNLLYCFEFYSYKTKKTVAECQYLKVN